MAAAALWIARHFPITWHSTKSQLPIRPVSQAVAARASRFSLRPVQVEMSLYREAGEAHAAQIRGQIGNAFLKEIGLLGYASGLRKTSSILARGRERIMEILY